MHAAARDLSGAARMPRTLPARRSGGHVAAHELVLGLRDQAEREAAAQDEREAAGRLDCGWTGAAIRS